MLTRRQSEYLVIILAFALVVIAWAVSSSAITLPTLPRIFQQEDTPVTLPIQSIDVPDVVSRQITARELQEALPAIPSEAAIYPDLLERQMMAVEAARNAAPALVPVNPAELSADYHVGVPVLTEMAMEDLTLKASLSRDVVVGLPLLTETALADQTRYAALSADYAVGLPLLSARSQAEAARFTPAIALPEMAGTAQLHLFEASLNWADFTPTAAPVSDYSVGLPYLTELARTEQTRYAALSADYVVGVPVLTARAMAERARLEALNADVRVGRPLAIRSSSPLVPMNQRIFEASQNWADFETIPVPRTAAAQHVFAASLNWADFIPVNLTIEPLRIAPWQGPEIHKASLNWADFLN